MSVRAVVGSDIVLTDSAAANVSIDISSLQHAYVDDMFFDFTGALARKQFTPVNDSALVIEANPSAHPGADGNNLEIVITDDASTPNGVHNVSFSNPTVTILADIGSGIIDFAMIKAAIIGEASVASEISCDIELVNPAGSLNPNELFADGAGTYSLAGGGQPVLALVMSDSSEKSVNLNALLDGFEADTNTGYDSLVLGVDNVLTLSDTSAIHADVTVDLTSLSGGGGGSGDHFSTEKAVPVSGISVGNDLTMDVNIHPAMSSDDVQDGGPGDDSFKDQLAVYYNGVRLPKTSYSMSAGGQDKLKFEHDLNEGDYIIVEVKATIV